VPHFFNTARNGILYMWGFRNGLTESGARFEQLVANLAFHEPMHNKLDAHPTLRSMADIHKLKNGGLSRQTGIAAGTKLSQADVNAMAPALTGRSRSSERTLARGAPRAHVPWPARRQLSESGAPLPSYFASASRIRVSAEP